MKSTMVSGKRHASFRQTACQPPPPPPHTHPKMVVCLWRRELVRAGPIDLESASAMRPFGLAVIGLGPVEGR